MSDCEHYWRENIWAPGVIACLLCGKDRFSPDLSSEWHKTMLAQCYKIAVESPDISTQVGTIIVHGSGLTRGQTAAYNGFVEGWIPPVEDYLRPRKYLVTEHAERRAIYLAAKAGIALEGATLYSTWGSCCDCGRAIVESGITKLIRHHSPPDEATDRWLESVALGDEIMKAGGVSVVDVHGPIPGAVKILRNGEIYDPSK